MIATPRFVFLHLHKSGGTFVNECLLRFVPEARQLGYHLPRNLIPKRDAHLPVLGFVRNPWSYYVSWYSFQSTRPRPNALYRILSNGGKLEFAGTIRNMLRLGEDHNLLEFVITALPETYMTAGLNLPGYALEAIRDSGMGFYSFLHAYMFGAQDNQLHVGRMEDLRTDLFRLLSEVDQPVSDEMYDYILNRAPANISPHADYSKYYDDELRDLVAQYDRAVIEHYNYAYCG